ncbi:CpsD/CapB family tyrosine-protein kinase [Clostridium grantii]|uniref:non-specific protein-tyrosine kinase n=1 Tax=Clostridium grantii DSM 8605 TaxID=1121316 RepID=A0A1M5T813_9CLOT|nr:CpsD/CapB family tyrosine-protein kinase [Clostridium grantii]SHH46836.1 capsular exopolysaccharide family [Clostridium grantii DSM 8605]
MLIVKRDAKSVSAEAYRTLRTNIQYSSVDKEMKTILLTSAGPGEGKSSTTGNLAYTLATVDKKVVIVDCDMRKPSVHKKMRLSNTVGLSNYLAGEVKLEEALQLIDKNIFVITSGPIPPNPADMLGSNKMKALISKLEENFDYVLLDTPPVIAVTDAQVLAGNVDGVVLVVASKQADKDAVVRAKELLLKVGANIIGVVLNKVEMRKGKGYGYQYYYYYGQDDKKSTKGKKTKKPKKPELNSAAVK